MVCWNGVCHFHRHISYCARAELSKLHHRGRPKTRERLDERVQQKDAATIANMYTNDGIFSNPGWTASGRTAIEDALNKEFALGIFKYTSITVDQAQRIGDMTYSRGTWAADKGCTG